jgi:uncharacterized protein (TIGR02001 family)
MKLFRHPALLLAATTIASTPALAADIYTAEPEVAAVEEESSGWEFDVAFGVAVTSRYVSRGVDQTRGPTVQAYIEPSYGIFYAGVWGSGVNFGGGDPDRVEYDLYAGVRPEFGNLSLDFGYVHYFYNRSGECCGEIYAKASYAFTDWFSAGGELYIDPKFDTQYGVLSNEISLPYDFTFSSAIGTWFDRANRDTVDWNAGLSYTFADTLTLDARYHDSNRGPARFVVTLSVDSSLSALMRR